MLLKSSERPRDFNAPIDTAEYKVEKANQELIKKILAGRVEVRRPEVGEVVSKPLDLAALKAKYDPAKETGIRYLMGVFRVPIGITQVTLDSLIKDRVTTWILIMQKQGWDWVRMSPIDTASGVYPARDLVTGLPDLGSREMTVRTQFKKRDIQIVKTELRPESYKALVVGENNVISTD